MLDTEYIDFILKADLSAASKKQYKSKLESMIHLTGKNIDWIITHPEELHKLIKQHYTEAQTKKAYYSTITALFKHCPKIKEENSKEYLKYYEYYKEISTEVKEKYRSGVPSEKQQAGYVEWTELLKKRDEIGEKDYGCKEHLLLSMYTYIPPVRQDFCNLRIWSKMPIGDKANQGNFIIIKKKSACVLVLNEYKTSKVYKHFEKELPPELCKIIHKSLELNPRNYLFVNSEGDIYDKEESYIRNINRTLQGIFDKPITVSIIRHSFITHERTQNRTPGDEEDSAASMLHSVREKNLYRFV